MDTSEIKAILMKSLALDEVYVSGGDSHFQIIAVSKQFTSMSRVKKQQMIYAPLIEYILDNRIHALSIKTYTPAEWQRDRKINGF